MRPRGANSMWGHRAPMAAGLLVAGHDTTASTLGLALFHLAQQPAAMAALRREQAAVRAAHGAALTPAALRAMPYAEAVLRETWRLHPVVPVVGRKTKEDVVLGEYQVRLLFWAHVIMHV